MWEEYELAIEETFGIREWEQGALTVLGLLRRKEYIDHVIAEMKKAPK